MDWTGLAGSILGGGGDASPAAPMNLQTSTGAINVGVPNGVNRGAILEPIMAGGSPYTGGYGIEPYNRLGFSSGGNPVYTTGNGGIGISTNMLMLAGIGILGVFLMRRRG